MKKLLRIMSIFATILIVIFIAIGMPPLTYLILFGTLIVAFIVLIPMAKNTEKLEQDGKVVKRDFDITRVSQVYTLSKINTDSLVAAMKSEGLPFEGLEWTTVNGIMGFCYPGWNAEMKIISSSGNQDVYEFNFTNWKSSRGFPHSMTQMNQLLTAIEKALLRIDINTKVKNEYKEITTKTDFI